MRFNIPLFLVISGFGLANVVQEKRETSLDMASVLSEASVLRTKFGTGSATYSIPFTTPGGNLLQPPASIVGAIITGVPASVLVALAQPSLRSSIASDFKAGHTPMWYQTLPPAVKSYIEALQTQISGGEVDLSATVSQVSSPAETGVGSKIGVADTSMSKTAGAVTTSSSTAMAARQTGGVAMSAVAAIGLLGAVIAL